MNRVWSLRFFFLFFLLSPFFSFLLALKGDEESLDLPPITIEKSINRKKEFSSKAFALFEQEEKELSVQMPQIRSSLSMQYLPSPFPGEEKYFLHISGSKEKVEIHRGDKLFLTYQGGRLSISDKETPFYLIFHKLEEKKAHCEQVVEAPFLQENRMQLSLAVTNPTLLPEKNSPFYLLSKAKYLGKNLLVERLSPDQSPQYNLIYRNHLISIQPSQFLTFENGEWKSYDHPKKGIPLARVKQIKEDNTIEFEGWDSSGDHYYLFALSSYSIPFNPVKIEDLLKNIRVRNEKQCSCTLDNHRVVFHVGDALIRDKGNWKLSRDLAEILAHRGEVFLVDSLEKKGRKEKLTGSYFSIFKNQKKEIALDVDKQIRKKHIRRKRK